MAKRMSSASSMAQVTFHSNWQHCIGDGDAMDAPAMRTCVFCMVRFKGMSVPAPTESFLVVFFDK
eukprot:1658145-Rhodomonas_salina.1